MVYACRTSCARNIIGVIPYFPYSKQCKMRKRGSIVSKLLASMMCKAGKWVHLRLNCPFHLWFIRKLGNYSLLTLSNVALSRSDSSHYYGFASKGNPGFLQHSSGQSPGLAVPATVHTGRSRSSGCHACCYFFSICPVKAFSLNNRSVHVMFLINRKQDRNLLINFCTQAYAFIYSWYIFSLAQMEGLLPLVSNEHWLYVNA